MEKIANLLQFFYVSNLTEGGDKVDKTQQNDDDMIHFINTAGINTK